MDTVILIILITDESIGGFNINIHTTVLFSFSDENSQI
jgi:hypothetical protein